MLSFKLKDLFFVLLCTSCLLFTLNYELVLGFRPVDLILMLLITLSAFLNPKFDRNILLLLSVTFLIMCLSVICGVFVNGLSDIERFGFIYKYTLIIFIPVIIINLSLTLNKIKIIYNVLLISFIFLSLWVMLYLYLLSQGVIKGAFRVSFPFSNYNISDAHLYSSYLSFFIIAYVLHIKRVLRHNFIIFCSILLLSFTSMILTGSRTGVVIVALAFFFRSLALLLNIRKMWIFVFLVLLLIVSMPIIKHISVSYLKEEQQKLLERAVSFELSGDRSSLSRLSNFKAALEEIDMSAYLIGVGPFSSASLWYDGLASMIFAHGGFLLFLMIVFLLLTVNILAYNNSCRTGKHREFYVFALLCFLYLLSNMITEYVMVTRNALPILVFLALLYEEIKLPYSEATWQSTK